jgi:hypothetical protein
LLTTPVTLYATPEWQNPAPEAGQSPYYYKVFTNIIIKEAIWQLQAGSIAAGDQFFASGEVSGSNGFTSSLPEKACIVDAGASRIKLVASSASTAFDGKTAFNNPLSITWSIRRRRAGTDKTFAIQKSENDIYVVLGSTTMNDPLIKEPPRTAVHLACSNSGAINQEQAFDRTWALLNGPANFNGWDPASKTWTRKLYYYRPGTTFAQNPVQTLYWPLLSSPQDTGQCGTWSSLMWRALLINNVTCSYKTIRTKGDYVFFLIKSWMPDEDSTSPYLFRYKGDMIEEPPVTKYGVLTPGTTPSGQNSVPPSQRVFSTHAVIEFTRTSGPVPITLYYDPNYGTLWFDLSDFQLSYVYGYGKNLTVPLPNFYRVTPVSSSGLQLEFVP